MKKFSDSIKNNKPKLKIVIKDFLSFVIPLIIFYIIATKVFFISVVLSESMEPTLKVGNTVVYNKIAYIVNPPQRGDAVVFYSEEFDEYYSKRIIGIPGDHISFNNGTVMINSEYLDESAYIPKDMRTDCYLGFEDFNVPKGYYFVMGDNREYSFDSRHWKQTYISEDMIIGKYIWQIDFSIQYDILEKF